MSCIHFGSAAYFATNRDDLEILQAVLNAGADIHACFENSRRTALTRAVENNNVTIVNFLLHSGADVNGCTIEHDSLDSFDLQSWRGGKYTEASRSFAWDDHHWRNYTPLQAASLHQDIEIARILIEAGADLNMDFTAGSLSETGHLSRYPGLYGTAVQIGAHQGNRMLVQLLCDAGADVNAPAYPMGGRTALQAAIENGDHTVIESVLAAGADVNAAAAENYGITALAATIIRQDSDTLGSIIEAGANLQQMPARHSEVTALAAAAANHDLRLIRMLLLAGVNPVDSLALEAAVANDDSELIRILMAAQASSNDYGKRDYGYLALGRATRDERHELVKLLLASNIDPNIHMSDPAGSMRYEPRTHQWICDIESRYK